ncbi:MAG TPA: hydrogenase 3 maturation endopeptidase HyCI [Armatimonadetes bacterium]|nr:hydrogenase 3 maturation endopeptidase HyCI [Armatimonadota bacterium]
MSSDGTMSLEILERVLAMRSMIIGIGNDMRADDGVGCWIARQLIGKMPIPVIDAGEIPESYLDKIRSHQPDCVVFIDAVDMGAEAGSIVVLDAGDLPETSPISTHRVSVKILADYIAREIGAQTLLLGIQPKTIEFGAPMSEAVRKAAETVVNFCMLHRGTQVHGYLND